MWKTTDRYVQQVIYYFGMNQSATFLKKLNLLKHKNPFVFWKTDVVAGLW